MPHSNMQALVKNGSFVVHSWLDPLPPLVLVESTRDQAIYLLWFWSSLFVATPLVLSELVHFPEVEGNGVFHLQSFLIW